MRSASKEKSQAQEEEGVGPRGARGSGDGMDIGNALPCVQGRHVLSSSASAPASS